MAVKIGTISTRKTRLLVSGLILVVEQTEADLAKAEGDLMLELLGMKMCTLELLHGLAPAIGYTPEVVGMAIAEAEARGAAKGVEGQVG